MSRQPNPRTMPYRLALALMTLVLCWTLHVGPCIGLEPLELLCAGNRSSACCQTGCDTGCVDVFGANNMSCLGRDAGCFCRGCSNNSHHQCGCSEERGCSFKLTEFNIYPTFSYLSDQVGNYTEFEFTSQTEIGWLEMENHTVLNVADLPSTISVGPTNPGDQPAIAGVRGNGFGDVLSGFFFSRKGVERGYELGIGPVVTFPSATNDIIGAQQWTIGPGVHFSTEIGKLDAGFFLWQSWRVGGSTNTKSVNQLFGKPFFIYKCTEDWHLVHIPLGLSHSWEAPSGDNWTIPIGGGVRRLFDWHGQKMGLQAQVFDYVARKPSDPEWELRFTIEFLFDD